MRIGVWVASRDGRLAPNVLVGVLPSPMKWERVGGEGNEALLAGLEQFEPLGPLPPPPLPRAGEGRKPRELGQANSLFSPATAAGTSSASVIARTTAALPTPTASTSRILLPFTPPMPTSDGITGCISFT